MSYSLDALTGYKSRSFTSQELSVLRSFMKSNVVRSKAYSGFLSKGARNRLKRCSKILCCVTPKRRVINPGTGKSFLFRCAFVTMTLPIDLSPKQEKKLTTTLIKPFCQFLVRTAHVKNYVWRVERTKAGRLHWHFIIDQPIHYKVVQNRWNRLLRKAGLLTAFAAQHGHYSPHSTEIKSVRSESKAYAYASKYMSKFQQSNLPVSGRLWDANSWLKSQRYISQFVGREFWGDVLSNLNFDSKLCSLSEHFVWISIELLERDKLLSAYLKGLFSGWLHDLRVESGWSIA